MHKISRMLRAIILPPKMTAQSFPGREMGEWAGKIIEARDAVLFWHAMTEISDADFLFMEAALEEARAAAERGEVPVGAVVVLDGRAVASAGNRTIGDCDPTAHAEIVALREAAKAVGNHRLLGATIYVTIEPCAMCAGAMVQARIVRLVYGADDPKGGAVRSCFSILDHPQVNHRVEVTQGVFADKAVALLQDFFAPRR